MANALRRTPHRQFRAHQQAPKVGAIRLGTGEDAVLFRIAPKILIARLMFLVEYAEQTASAWWDDEEISAREEECIVAAVARAFGRAAQRALRSDVLTGYRDAYDELTVIRGRIRAGDQLTAEIATAGLRRQMTTAHPRQLASEVENLRPAAVPRWPADAVLTSAAGRSGVIARRRGEHAGPLLSDGPGACIGFASMLGPAAVTLGWVGVTASVQGRDSAARWRQAPWNSSAMPGTRNCHVRWPPGSVCPTANASALPPGSRPRPRSGEIHM